MKIVTIIGARPQFIKAAVLSRLIQQSGGCVECLVHTGQHYDPAMSEVFFAELELPRPNYQLHIGSGSHAAQTAGMLVELETILLRERPHIVLVYGDTNTTLAGALAAVKLGVPIAHVEAGLRSFDRTMPEEINRIVADRLATWFFCPTETAVANLAAENVAENVHLVGDVMCDALQFYGRQEQPAPTLDRIALSGRPYALCTLHRAGNTDDPARLRALWEGLRRLAELLPIVLPLHPRTRKISESQGLRLAANVYPVEPVGYREMLTLERQARLIVTDSGGVQKEAYMQGVPCLTLRDNTEWVETVASGWNRLVGADPELLLRAAGEFLRQGPLAERPPLYGDGQAGQRILAVLQHAGGQAARAAG